MKKSFNRLDRINSLLYREVAALLLKDFMPSESPKQEVLTNLSRVETTPDLKEAKIFFTVFPETAENKIKTLLNKKAAGWQKIIGLRLSLKRKPKLKFMVDAGMKNAIKVEKILSQIEKEKEKFVSNA
jgi:ribosome-binding factor A